MLSRLRTRLKRTPIFYRIAIGNAIIIILGGVAGTILTRILTDISATLWHFVLFASVGILISLVINLLILRAALQPIQDLRQTVNRIQAARVEPDSLQIKDTDPDVYQLSKTLNSLITRLESSNQQLRLLSERTINAQEEERKRIARSLHDDTGQSLSTLILNLGRLENHLPADETETISRLASLRQAASGILDGLRGIIYDLRPAILDDLGLLSAIRWYAQTNLEQAGILVELDFPEHPPSLPQMLTTTLFRVTQESVNNIIRHSGAKKACIALGFQENEVYLKISDDGHGFDPAQIGTQAIHMQHWGLIGIQERVELVRGRMSIHSDPQNGTTINLSLPYQVSEGNYDG